MSLPFNLAFSGISSGLQTKNATAGGGGVGGWVELGRTTLGSANFNMTVSSLANKRYYMVLMSTLETGSGATNWLSRIGNSTIDTGSNYSRRKSQDGGAEVTATSTNTFFEHFTGQQTQRFGYHYISNYATKEKLGIGQHVSANTVGAGTAPYERNEIVNKWANTSNVMDVFQLRDDGAGSETYGAGSEVVVLGWDPADTHTTNFWTELASVELGSAGTSLASGTILAKKYLWVQAYLKHTGSDPNPLFRVNGDTGNNYASRQSINGGAENVEASIDHFDIYGTTASSSGFINMFIINNSANEKLVIAHHILQNTAGAGNAPTRGEHVIKWANTSSQITSIACTTTSNTFDAGSIIKIWGSD